jgi:hypothetical protein
VSIGAPPGVVMTASGRMNSPIGFRLASRGAGQAAHSAVGTTTYPVFDAAHVPFAVISPTGP